MRKIRRRTIFGLAAMLIFCWIGRRATGQADFQVPQYPQYVQYPQGAPPVTPPADGTQATLTADQLDQLLGQIALYPDPLLSLIFPAATYPDDVVAAEKWLQSTPNPTESDIDAQSWDASIKGLVHYPTVLKMMSDQTDWTQALGAAYLNQQQDVMDSVQRLRAQAQAAKNLQTTPQEQIVDDSGSIRIEPVDPDVIYVPQYDPALVYTAAYPITFGIGFPIGLWCDNDFDWHRHDIVIGGGWYRGWHHPVEWDRHPPAWDRHPAGWVASPRPWARSSRRPPPRITSAAVAHLGLDRPRGAVAGRGASARPAVPARIGRAPEPAPSRNAFQPANTREEVQRQVQRAHPAPARPAPAVRAAPQPVVRESPHPVEARPAPRAAPPRPAPSNAFRAGPAAPARAQSARGNASVRRR